MSEVQQTSRLDHMRKAVGDRIYNRRMLLGLTQAELARKAGVCTQVVSYVERGLKDLRVSTYFKLCRALDLAAGLTGPDGKKL